MMPPGRAGITAARSASAWGPSRGLIRTHRRRRAGGGCASRKAAVIPPALGLASSVTASSRSRRTMSAADPAAFSILRSLSPGANSQERALKASSVAGIASPSWAGVRARFRHDLTGTGVSWHRALVGLGEVEDLLGQEVEDHVGADRRGARDQHLAQVALDVVLLRIAHAV